MKHKIVLASTSPFRKNLMNKLEIDFESLAPEVNESNLKEDYKGPAKKLCSFLAKHKALSLKNQFSSTLVIGSDQSLFCDSKTLGKGKTFEGAFEQLKFCSGKQAELITSVYIHDTDGEDLAFENSTQLDFKVLTDDEITKYLKWDEPYGCAGSFKFESKGSFLFERIRCSDPSSIEGLPMMELVQRLKEKGVIFNFI